MNLLNVNNNKNWLLLFVAALTFHRSAVASGYSLVESSCVMRVRFATALDVSLESAYDLESETSSFFESLIEDYEFSTNVKALQVRVDVADRLITSTTAVVTAAVSLLYETNNVEELPDLCSILEDEVNSIETMPEFSFGGMPEFTFSALDDPFTIIEALDSDERTSSEIGLIVVISFLSIFLCLVSSVLLYITGGFTMCGNGIMNCLFEEVEEEQYPVHQKQTFQSRSVEDEEEEDNDEDDDNDEDEDEVSHMTSVPPSSASGILGVHRNINAQVSSDDESSVMYGDSATPMSESGGLGIASVRKHQKSSNTFLGRFRSTPQKP